MTRLATEKNAPPVTGRSLRALLELTPSGPGRYVAECVFDDPYPMYGGQLAALALHAAALTLPEPRTAHALHGNFLRPGDSGAVTELEVEADRDGKAFSARRVVAKQNGKVIFTMTASFHKETAGPSQQVVHGPEVPRPEDAAAWAVPRLFSFDAREVPQRYSHDEMRTRFWARCTEDLGDDDLHHALAIAYFADITNATAHFDTDTDTAGPSLDYSTWFHRRARADEWMLLDLVPHTISGGRGFYTGEVFNRHGVLLASLAQETLYQPRTASSYFPHGLGY